MSEAISPAGAWSVGAGAAVMAGALGPWQMAVIVASVLLVTAVVRRGGFGLVVVAALVLGGAVSGEAASRRVPGPLAEAPAGFDVAAVTVRADPQERWGWYGVATPVALDGRPWDGPHLAIGPLDPTHEAGTTLVVRGRIRSGQRRLGREVVAGTLEVGEVLEANPTTNPVFRLGNAARGRVRDALAGATSAHGLAVGLLIGDTSGIGAHEMEDLRRAGLSHFVAVSGSNVAVFLMAWWIIGAPLSIHPRVRSIFGLVGLAVFVVATRWEPSVVRASVMSGVVLIGGGLGMPVDPWIALGVAVSGLVLVAGDLAASVGFQLSILATAGVLVGVRLVEGRRPGWLWTSLGATIGAQVAVAPLLLAVFGTIPLLAPLSNLVAAPVVALTTAAGVVALVVPVGIVGDAVVLGSRFVLWVASATSGGPQLGTVAFLAACVVATLAVWRTTRPLGVAIAGLVMVGGVFGAAPWPSVPTVVVLDVGQGDAVLVMDPSGATMLVDGGREPRVLDDALRRNGVERISVLVATHGDADHAGGLVELPGSMPIGEVWVPAFGERGALLDSLVTDAGDRSLPVRSIRAGHRHRMGEFVVEVLGPSRRFQSDNDGSIVMMLDAGKTMLLAGDVGAVAQSELPPLRPDIMLVPHHGAGTTDLRWLADTVGSIAILSYGPNTYGHPHADVVDTLERAGAEIHATDLVGDVRVALR